MTGAQDTYREGYDAGYTDGVEAGSRDRNEGQPYDFANKMAYQEASRGFDDNSHDRDVYAVAFQRGFEDGYEEGYGLGRGRQAPQGSSTSAQRSFPSVAVSGRTTVPKGTQMRVRLLQTLTTQRNEIGDDFRAEVVEPLLIDGEEVISARTRIYGVISHLKRAGRIKGRSEMNLKFTQIDLPHGNSVPIEASVVSVEERRDEEVKDDAGTVQGPGEKGKDAKKVGTSTGIGALIGILTGGAKGAKIGAAVGAVAGLAGVLATRGSDMVLHSETELVIRLDQDISLSTGVLRAESGP